MALIDVKCECGHSFKVEFEQKDEIAFCEACGSLVINDLAPEIEDKIERIKAIKREITELEAEKKKLDLEIRIGLEGAPIGIGKNYQVNYSSSVAMLLDTKRLKADLDDEFLKKYMYESPRDRITIKELK